VKFKTEKKMQKEINYVIRIKRKDDDWGFATKHFPMLDHPPAIGSVLWPEVRGVLNDIVYTTVVDNEYLLTDGIIYVVCELGDAEDADAFTIEKGWKISPSELPPA
jgi:hypothetical protein